MNDHDKEFEAKLASMRPTEPSEDLIDRIAFRVSDQQPTAVDNDRRVVHYPFRIWSACAGLAAAVILALTFWLWFAVPSDMPDVTRREPVSNGEPVITPPEIDGIASQEIDETSPTLGNFIHAMRESPEALDVLLQKHAQSLMPATRNVSLSELLEDTSS